MIAAGHPVEQIGTLTRGGVRLAAQSGGCGMGWRHSVIVLLALQSSVTLSQAADISVAPVKGDFREAIVLIEGELVASDADQFRAKVAPYAGGVVLLESPGGSVLAGIEIGRTIRLRNFLTWVPSGVRCASACAAAWLGDTKRLMGKNALVGFHAAYRVDQGRMAESAAGNAVLGGYLSQIGLSDRAIIYITQTAPSSMTWLTLSDAERVGIDVAVYDPEDKQAPNKPDPPQAAPASLQTRAMAFLETLYQRTSGPTEGALSALNSWYGASVRYYGKDLSRDQVVSQISTFLTRWPIRRYEPDWPTVSVQCLEASRTCVAKGRLRFDARSAERNEQSLGVATFEYTLVFPPGDQIPRIVAEDGSVLDRKKQALVQQDAAAPLSLAPPTSNASSVGQGYDPHRPR